MGVLQQGSLAATIRKRTKQWYKADTRRRLRRQNYVRCEIMGNTLATNHFRDFLKEVKKINKSKHCANKAPVILKLLNYGQLSKNLYNRCDPSNRHSLLDQLHSVITGDDLVPIVIDSDTVVGAL